MKKINKLNRFQYVILLVMYEVIVATLLVLAVLQIKCAILVVGSSSNLTTAIKAEPLVICCFGALRFFST